MTMCANEVQFQLQPAFIDGLKKRNPAQFEEYIKSGSIIANQDGTYSSADAKFRTVAANGVFSAASVEGAGGVKETKTLDSATPAKGLGVEHSAAKAKEGVKEEKTVTFKLDDFVKQSGLAEDKRAELVKEFEAAGLSIDKEKGIVTYDKTKYDTAITKFAKNNRLSYLSTNEDGKAIADKLAEDGKITLNEDGGYVINGAEGKKAVDEAFPTQTQAPVETRENKSVKINTEVTTTTTEESEPVKVADDLKHNRAGRKQARKDYEAALTEWVKDPENQSTMNISIARNKYEKKISKQMGKIEKECKTKEEIVQKYLKEYATDEEKVFFNTLLNEAVKDEDALLEAYKRGTGDGRATFEGDTGAAKKKIAAYLRITEDPNFDSNVILERMAVVDVLGKRSEKQVAKDKKEFIQDEAKRQAKAAETKQNIDNTRVHFSKAERKEAAKGEENSAIEHTDIGKAGRKLVMECPDEFCTKGTKNDCDFEVNGKYYKFSETKFKDFCDKATDSRTLDNETQESFAKDGNLTLNEGRQGWMSQTLITKDGKRRSIEEIIGNDNGRVGNGELDKLRHLVEKGGNSVDTNSTKVKRALHILKGVGIGGALGFGTAYAASWLAGAVNLAGETASQFVQYKGRTDDRIYTGKTADRTFTGRTEDQTFSGRTADQTFTGRTADQTFTGRTDDQTLFGTTADRTIHDRTTFNYTDNGETFTKVVNKDIFVKGQDWSVVAPGQDWSVVAPGQEWSVTAPGQEWSVTAPGQEWSVTAEGQEWSVTAEGQEYSGQVEAEGQKWEGRGNKHLKTAINAAIFGGIGGGVNNALSMGKVHAKGRSFDGIVNLNKKKEKTETENKEQTLDIPQFVTREEREVQTPDKNIDNFTYKIKVSHKKGTNYNLAEDRLSIVKKMYNIQDDATANKVLEYVMTQINGYKSNPYKLNYAGDLTYHFPSEIPAGMIAGIDDTIIGTDPNTIGGFDRNQIPLGGKNGKNASEANLRKKGFIARANVITR